MDPLWNPARLAVAFVVLCAIFVPLDGWTDGWTGSGWMDGVRLRNLM